MERFLRFVPWIAALLAVVAAWPSVTGEFVYDDYPYVVENADLRGGWDRVPLLFESSFPSVAPERGLYRPITALSYRLDRLGASRPDPVRHHATNLALVFLLTWLAARAFRSWLPAGAAAAAALLFAVHPVQTEAVAWVTGRSELLAALGALGAFLAAVRVARGGGAIWFASAVLAVILGTWSKENALVVVPLFALFVLGRRQEFAGRALVRASSALALGAVVALGVRASVLGAFGPAAGERVGAASLLDRLPLVVAALGEHLRLLFVPWPLSLERMSRPPVAWSDPAVGLGGVVIAAYGVLLVVAWRRSAWRFVALWPLAALLPVMHFIPIGEAVAERFLLLPSLGIAGLIAALGAALVSRAKLPAFVGPTATALLIAAGLAGSWQYASVWRFESDVWKHALAHAPQSATAWTAYGDSYARRGWSDKAVPHFRRALELDPGLTVARLALAQAYDTLGRPDLALEETERAARSDLSDPVACNNLGARLAREGREEEALEWFLRAVERAPRYAPALRNAALATAAAGDPVRARELWERARAADPSLPPPDVALPTTFRDDIQAP